MADSDQALDAHERVLSWLDEFVAELGYCSDLTPVASSLSSSKASFFWPEKPSSIPQSPLFVPLGSPTPPLAPFAGPQTDYIGVPIGSPCVDPGYWDRLIWERSGYPVENSLPETSLTRPRPAWWIPFPVLSHQDHLNFQNLITELRGWRPPVMEDKKTPSSVGDIEAAEPTSISGAAAPLSVRADTDNVAHSHTAVHHAHSGPLLQPSHMAHADQSLIQTIQPSALTVESVEEYSPGSIRLGPSEFAVTLPMDSRVKDDYERAITDGAADMRAFLASFDPSLEFTDHERNELLLKAQEVATQLNNVSIYPDLNIPPHIRFNYFEIEQEASWMEYSSSKFLFLKYWIDLTASDDLHVILAVQDDIKQKIVERYLLGKGFTYTQPREELGGNSEVSMTKGSMSFGIHSSDTTGEPFKKPSAIFALDASFDPTSHSVRRIRTTFTRSSGLLPIIWFLVANTCEHVSRCLPDLSQPDRLRLLLQETTRLHDEVGDLQDDALGVYEDADEIRKYLLYNFVPWPLPIIEPLHFPSDEDDQRSSTPLSEDRPSGAQKRLFQDDESEESSTKRVRTDLQDTTQSIISTTSLQTQPFQALQKGLIDINDAHVLEKTAIQDDLSRTKAQLQELEQALSSLQHRYETRTKNLHKIREERDSLLADRTALEERLARQKEDMSKLKEERSLLRKELDEARQELKNGGGSLASLESAREDIRRLTKENSSLERKAEYSQSQTEYTREQYQTASTVAAQAVNEARELQEQNQELSRKLAENLAQLREMNMQNSSAIHLARIEELETILAARDDLLRRKEEELREIRKNRPSTRSTSTQPRSPKWAAGSRPTSPGLNNNGNGNGLAGRGSALRFSSEMPF